MHRAVNFPQVPASYINCPSLFYRLLHRACIPFSLPQLQRDCQGKSAIWCCFPLFASAFEFHNHSTYINNYNSDISILCTCILVLSLFILLSISARRGMHAVH